jgi:hypothetical protein
MHMNVLSQVESPSSLDPSFEIISNEMLEHTIGSRNTASTLALEGVNNGLPWSGMPRNASQRRTSTSNTVTKRCSRLKRMGCSVLDSACDLPLAVMSGMVISMSQASLNAQFYSTCQPRRGSGQFLLAASSSFPTIWGKLGKGNDFRNPHNY